MTGQHNRSRWRWRFGSRTKSFLRKATRRERLLWRNCFAGPSSSNLTSQDVFYTWLKYLADRVEFDATAKQDITNLLANCAYFEAICRKLFRTLPKFDLKYPFETDPFFNLMWLVYIFIENSFSDHKGNI